MLLVKVENVNLPGELTVPKNPRGLIIFAHGSGSSHKSPRQQKVSKALHAVGFATLLFDLLTSAESEDRKNVFDIRLLSERLIGATKWVQTNDEIKALPIGYFGASTGAAAALTAAAREPKVKSVVSRGGRPDLAIGLENVEAPVLLLVGGNDYGVIELNERAKLKLKNAQVVIVPGAGHLFEEEGTLDEVIERATNWFEQTLGVVEATDATPSEQLIQRGRVLAKPLTSEKSIVTLAKELSSTKIVMLGEATHGTEEFYRLRREISEELLEKHGFDFVAVEGDWPDCYKLNQYIKTGQGDNAEAIMQKFNRWPTWMWANQQTEMLVEWMRGLDSKKGFYGLDVYSLYDSLEAVKKYAEDLDPFSAAKVLEAYLCFESFNRDEKAYARSLIKLPDGCESEVIDSLRNILRLRLKDTKFKEEEFFDLQQNSKIVANAEKYYRAMVQGTADSWNIRDMHMLETLDALLRRYGPNSKGIVWAHNTHIGDYHATDMVVAGYVNLGGLARERWGMENVTLVGFGTYQGKVLAGKAWGAKPQIMKLAPAPAGTYEDYLHRISKELDAEIFYLPVQGEGDFSGRHGHRAVGVVYQPVFEEHRQNYVPTHLSKRYDVFVFIDQTHALKAFPSAMEKGLIPELWPSGF